MMHYAKGVAHAALGDVAEAEAEQALFREASVGCRRAGTCTTTPSRTCSRWPRRCSRARSRTGAASTTRPSPICAPPVALEDDLPYDEPWGWMQPIRHALGALLLEQGRVAEAEAVYREDLGLGGTLPRARHPDNLWSLRGLLDCLDRRGETVEAALIKQRLDLAMARAEVPVKASCFCRMKVAA